MAAARGAAGALSSDRRRGAPTSAPVPPAPVQVRRSRRDLLVEVHATPPPRRAGAPLHSDPSKLAPLCGMPDDPDSILGPLLHGYSFAFHRFALSGPTTPAAPLVFDQLVNIPGVPATLPFTGSLQGVHLADDEDMTLRSWVASGGLKTTVPSLQLRLGRSKADNDGQAATLVRYAQGTAIIVVSVGLYALLTFA